MKLVLQRVSQASVTVDEQVVGKIGPGIVVLVGFGLVIAGLVCILLHRNGNV